MDAIPPLARLPPLYHGGSVRRLPQPRDGYARLIKLPALPGHSSNKGLATNTEE
ncbi:MAG: hypothetical protein U0361_22295 [Nitrospiraceae bacterium]